MVSICNAGFWKRLKKFSCKVCLVKNRDVAAPFIEHAIAKVE